MWASASGPPLHRGEGRLPGEGLEQQAAERVDVCARIHALVQDLLGRDVLGSGDDGSRAA